MSANFALEITTEIDFALSQLQALITAHYPNAVFEVALGTDPEGIYLTTFVNGEDKEGVVDTVIDLLLEIQIDRGLPVYVIPLQLDEAINANEASLQGV